MSRELIDSINKLQRYPAFESFHNELKRMKDFAVQSLIREESRDRVAILQGQLQVFDDLLNAIDTAFATAEKYAEADKKRESLRTGPRSGSIAGGLS